MLVSRTQILVHLSGLVVLSARFFFKLVASNFKWLQASHLTKQSPEAKKRAHLLKIFSSERGKFPPKPPRYMPSHLMARSRSCVHPKPVATIRNSITFKPLRTSLDLGVLSTFPAANGWVGEEWELDRERIRKEEGNRCWMRSQRLSQ